MKKYLLLLTGITSIVFAANVNATENESFRIITISGKADKHTYVDLGLPSGTLWATCNVGANNATEPGNFYAWGETEPKEEYSWQTYKWTGKQKVINKYNNNQNYGNPDNKYVLDAEDDAATVNWGKKWRTPTSEELTELRIHCNWEWTRNYNGTGAVGRIGISKTNGNIIFLPAGGYRFSTNVKSENEDGGYWSSTLCENYSYRSYSFNFRDINVEWHHSRRFSGRNVRPVLIKK